MLLKAIYSPSNCVSIDGILHVQFESSISRIVELDSSLVVHPVIPVQRPFPPAIYSLSLVLRYVLCISYLCHLVRFVTISCPLFSSQR